jgi:hypothetical protein
LNDCEENQEYLDKNSTEGNDNESQASNVTFNAVTKAFIIDDDKRSIHDDSNSSKETNNDDDNPDESKGEDVEHKRLIEGYELLYAKWLEVIDLNRMLKREVKILLQDNSSQQQYIKELQ